METKHIGVARSWWTFAAAASLSLAAGARAEVRTGKDVTVGPAEIVEEDLYVSGGTVRIDGKVKGDLVVVTGQLTINGEVGGDVLSAAGTTTISGPVRGSIRATGGQIALRAPVGEDAIVAGGRLSVEPGAQIGRDAMLAGGAISLHGPVARDVAAAGGSMELDAAVGRDAKLYAGTLKLTDQAKIAGALRYTSNREASISPQAKVGTVTRMPMPARPGATPLGFVFRWLRAIVAFTALGLLLGAASPRLATLVPQTLQGAPWRSLGYGSLCLAVAPVAVVVLFVAGALLGGWWLGLIAVALVLIVVALSFPAVGFLIGKLAFEKLSKTAVRRGLILLAGIVVLTLVIRIPYLGALVAVATVLFGFGALVLSALELRRRTSA